MPKYVKCLICGGTCYYSKDVKSMPCMFCGDSFYTNFVCENDHYVCDECQMGRALEMITATCEESKKKEAIALAFQMMTNKWLKIDGPEYPYLVAATLLTAYKNRGYSTKTANRKFPSILDEAKKRALKIAMNPREYWGCSGEAIGCGIFASLIPKVTPAAKSERGAANLLTSRVLEQISIYGGPRCGKRESLIAIFVASQFAEEHWNMPLTDFEGAECIFYKDNPECTKSECPFFPIIDKEK